ncbi:MAG: UTP--glucose-1-phosphate uridylyltransferase GalU [Nitrospirae bacterium]|nr:UTP--glucose-1-phosphate uridylyltransferase GalU [Nitrospirota bacterium]
MRISKAVFPVAGLGTRFLPATKAIPKELLPVVDKPIIQYAVDESLNSGIEQLVFVTGKGKSSLEDHFDISFELENALKKRGKDKLLKQIQEMIPETGTIVYTRQNEPLGLGHAIWCARDVIGDEPFAVLLADDLLCSEKPVIGEMINLFDRLRASVVAIVEVDPHDTANYGIIDAEPMGDGVYRIKSMVEKPKPEDAPSNLAIIGRYILTPKIFEILGNKTYGTGGEIQLTDAMSQLLQEQPIFGYRFEGKRYDCGDKAGFQMANIAYALKNPKIKAKLLPFLKSIVEMEE